MISVSFAVRNMAVSQHATLPVSLKHVSFSLSGGSVFLNEPLNPPLSSHLCIGNFIAFSQVKDFLPQEQTTEKKNTYFREIIWLRENVA